MSAANTATHYGSVARTLHWITALLILTAIAHQSLRGKRKAAATAEADAAPEGVR